MSWPSSSSVSGVDAVPIEVVIDAAADCSDRERAASALAASLAAARGPRRSPRRTWWLLQVQVTGAGAGVKAADARIWDDAGHLVAERSVSDKTNGSCSALVRAVSAWTQIVLDDEMVRGQQEPGAPPPAPAPTTPVQAPASSSSSGMSSTDGVIKAPSSSESGHTVEVGTTMMLRNGVAARGGLFGASPFVTVSFSKTWILRPSAIIGTSTSRVPPDETKQSTVSGVGGRLDFCKRVPGNYIDRRGIELDVCAGGDLLYVWSDLVNAMRSSVGPSAVLRGEVTSNLALEIRGMVGANLARGDLGADASFVVGSGELGASVRFE